jgi:dUTP pyrophosphatase
MSSSDLEIEFMRTDSRAVVPTKAHDSDIGYDLTAIDVFKRVSGNTVLYETGIAIKPPHGYYIEILPRSSITKTGMMLANSVGIIDPDYRDSLKIAVRTVDDSLEQPKLPFCRFQLVLRKAESATLCEVKSLNDTERGTGGFGSTDVCSNKS